MNEMAAGNWHAKNWQDEVKRILEDTVSYTSHVNGFSGTLTLVLAR